MAQRRKNGNVTLKDIAAETGFSANTVSRALADKPDISEETKEVIRRKAEEMGYIANALASFLRSGVSRNISIIVGDISNPHFSVMVKEMQMKKKKKGYNSIIFNTEENLEMERQAITVSISQNVDGIILCPAPGGEANIGLLRHYGKPFVLIGRRLEAEAGSKTSYVVCDDENSGYTAMRCLLEQGHRRVLFFNGPKEISSARERLTGYRRALREAGIAYDGSLVHTVPVTAGKGTQRMRRILSGRQDYTAVLAFSDLLAWQAVCILEELGKSVPRDCSVIGFDNIHFAYPHHLTSISSSKTTMARRCVQILLKQLGGRKGEEERVVLETELVKGDTVRGIFESDAESLG